MPLPSHNKLDAPSRNADGENGKHESASWTLTSLITATGVTLIIVLLILIFLWCLMKHIRIRRDISKKSSPVDLEQGRRGRGSELPQHHNHLHRSLPMKSGADGSTPPVHGQHFRAQRSIGARNYHSTPNHQLQDKGISGPAAKLCGKLVAVKVTEAVVSATKFRKNNGLPRDKGLLYHNMGLTAAAVLRNPPDVIDKGTIDGNHLVTV